VRAVDCGGTAGENAAAARFQKVRRPKMRITLFDAPR
jgi:hypothetical protein